MRPAGVWGIWKIVQGSDGVGGWEVMVPMMGFGVFGRFVVMEWVAGKMCCVHGLEVDSSVKWWV